MFLWVLPATLVLTGLLGFNADTAENTANDVGLGKVTAQTVGEAAYQAHRARWVLIVIGLVFLVSVSRTLGVTVRTAVALTWQQPVRRGSPYLQTAGITALVLICVVVIGVVTSWLRNNAPGLGLVAAVSVVVVWTLGWWAISLLLPHPPLPWWGLLPGAVLVGVGAEIMHLVILLYLEPRVTSASALYGSLGAAATLLLGAYFIARLVLGSAALNATIHARRAQSSQLAELAESRADPLSASVQQFEESGGESSGP
jgi:uncharacterized BrkB/YihY/UPF0761 family membrane protein